MPLLEFTNLMIMIQLAPELLVGKGKTRSCYVHPDDPDKCIKIDHHKTGGPTSKEAAYYNKLARIRPDLSYTHIPRFHGFVETSLGRGGVFDLIRDETDGQISRSLTSYLAAGEVSAEDPKWRQAHCCYLETLFDEAVIIRDFTPGNICVRKLRNGQFHFVTIDGIGHRDLIPLCDYSRWFTRRKIRRHLERKSFHTIEGIFKRIEDKRKARRVT